MFVCRIMYQMFVCHIKYQMFVCHIKYQTLARHVLTARPEKEKRMGFYSEYAERQSVSHNSSCLRRHEIVRLIGKEKGK